MSKGHGIAQAGLAGEPADDGADVLQVPHAGPARRMLDAHLEEDVDERARLEVLAAKPIVEDVEDRQEAVLWRGATTLGPRLDELPGPKLLPALEKREHELVLGGKVAIEGRLGDPGRLDHLIDAHIPDAPTREQLVGTIENSLPRARFSLGICGPRLQHAI